MNPQLRRLLPALAGICIAVAARPAFPQADTDADVTLPAWVVPVLRLVSATHVEPTTGVVIASGRVLVPLDFAQDGDEIVVLDGGTDIVRNGRPARVERRFAELGLKVLAAEGLQRRAAPFAATPLTDGATVTLAAFPPAENIEEGAPPLRQAATLLRADASSEPAIAADSALPNVTGALLDACGYLAGYSIADGVQAMAPSPATAYRWQDALARLRQALGLPDGGQECRPAVEAAAPALAEEKPPEPQPEAEPETETEPPPEPEAEPPVAEPEPEPLVEILPPHEGEAADMDEGLQEEQDAPASTAPGWWLAGALLLIAAGLAVHRLRRSAAAAGMPDAATEPGPGPEPTTPTAAALDGQVTLRGQYADGRVLECSAPASLQAVNLEIGRGAADLVLDSPAVSRRHARLGGRADALTLTDLGSSNGSSVNGVPCLEGEILYVEPGAVVILGDVRFTVELESATGGDTDSPGPGSAAP